MRTLIINMLAAALLLFGASSASAFSITHTTNYDGFTELGTSDTVTVHVFTTCSSAGAPSVTSRQPARRIPPRIACVSYWFTLQPRYS